MSNAVEMSPERLFTQEMVSSDISFIALVIYVYQGFRLCFKFYKLSLSFKKVLIDKTSNAVLGQETTMPMNHTNHYSIYEKNIWFRQLVNCS